MRVDALDDVAGNICRPLGAGQDNCGDSDARGGGGGDRSEDERCGGGGLLAALGVAPGARVGVVVPNGPDLMVALVVIMARRTAVPVNPLAAAAEVGQVQILLATL
jgi:hypothetical protein